MPGLGTIVNCAAILAGSLLGLILKRGFPEKWQQTIMQGIGICTFVIGLQMAQESKKIILVIISIAVGTVIGEALDLDGRLQRFGEAIQKKILGEKKSMGSTFGEAFVTASLIFCIGAMAILGSLEDGLRGNHEILFAKATLDGIMSVIFTAHLGVGTALSAVPVGLYQGSITLLAVFLQKILTPQIITEIAATGGILIMAIGINLAGLCKIRLANQIPALVVAFVLARYFL